MFFSKTASPNIEFGPEYFEGLTVKAGDNIRLKVTITGRPVPKVVWSRNGIQITKKLMDIINVAGSSTLFVRDADRTYSGLYTVEATNSSGCKKENILVQVQGKHFYFFYTRRELIITAVINDSSLHEDTPGEPVGPIIFSNISEGKCTLSWNPPENDGCSEISHFIIEKRETSKISWALVSDECTQCTFNATKLMKTNEYQFRVSAVNKFGVSRALESTPIIAQLQYSRSTLIGSFPSVKNAFQCACS